MNNFEDQLTTSARRQREQIDGQLQVPKLEVNNPYSSQRTITPSLSWGWFATPAAAAIGLLIGLSIPRPSNTGTYTDTATDYTATNNLANSNHGTTEIVLDSDTIGHTIIDDQTDYSLLISL